ncbi:hypothetical protein FHG87_002659 [Trinorchestia longiramus]|nr:hypothetical protein FHG87_002659 [Trinorchestia longiramus]
MSDIGVQQLLGCVQKQLARLHEELEDLEEMKEDLSEEEYAEMKSSITKRLHETETTLKSMQGGSPLGQNVTGPSRHLGRDATAQLREEVRGLDLQFHANSLTNLAYTDAKVSLLQQLSSVGQLTESERSFLANHAQAPLLVEASQLPSGMSEKLLQAAAKQS